MSTPSECIPRFNSHCECEQQDNDRPRTVGRRRGEGRGPSIWLAGDPADLKRWVPLGAAGIVTNTVVQREMVEKYGPLTDVIKRYLDITDLPIVVEIDGESKQELLDVGSVFTEMSDQIILKIPCTVHGLETFRALAYEGVETFCTTVFSLTQAAADAAAGATHILPFCDPIKQMGGDPTLLIREMAAMFDRWKRRPYVTAALVRSVDVAYAALRDGADGIIVFWPIFRDMMRHPLSDQWNTLFMDEWKEMEKAGKLSDLPTTFVD